MNFPEISSRQQCLDVRSRQINGRTSLCLILDSVGAWLEDKEFAAAPESWALLAQALFAGSRYE
jgi:hypothetical protein